MITGAEADVLDAAALAAFDPADYPYRVLVLPERPAADAIVSAVWIPTPWPEATLRGMLATMAAGGGLYLMARDRGELVRMRETVELILSVAAEA